MKRKYLKLQPSETTAIRAATQIYSAYLLAGRVPEGSEEKWMDRSINEALYIAVKTDEMVISDNEVD